MQLTHPQFIITNAFSNGKRRVAVLAATVALADFLSFRQAFGLNLFLLSILLTFAILISARKPPHPITATVYLSLSAIASAPLLEAPTASGFIISMAAVILIALKAAKLLPKRPSAIPLVLLRFMPSMLTGLPKTYRRYSRSLSGRTIFGAALKSLTGWMLPLGMGLVFLLLFSAANPLIEMGLHNIDLRFMLNLLDISRLAFWLAAASLIWAMIRPRLTPKRRRSSIDPVGDSPITGLLDHRALVRSLAIFNLLFAMQTALDLIYLWGGAELPAGMSHAEYAHRGAYPLVATALLAAAFVLIAMRRGGPGDASRLIRALVIAWIIQNVLLCLSSILRLDLYVEAYSLTHLRLAAGVWMGLVATGLMFILLRIALRRSNEWLISMNLLTLATVLYFGAFFDSSAFIARFNVENSLEFSQHGTPLDIHYLASLGPSAIPALDLYLSAAPEDGDKRRLASFARQRLAFPITSQPPAWRSWSYRQERMKNYLLTRL
ncbi:hypothetical protein D3C73_468910 [compost metagenome]